MFWLRMKSQVYALQAGDFEELLGDLHDAFLEHAKLMYSQKTVKSMTGEDKHSQLVSSREDMERFSASGTVFMLSFRAVTASLPPRRRLLSMDMQLVHAE